MKIVKNIIRLCAAAIAVLPIIGCSEEEYVKPSALLSESSLTFEAIGAEPQSLTIASDEAWFIDVDADWITVDPTSGTNTVDVTVSVTDNVANGAMAAPREGTLTIANNRGYSIRTVIYQKGDTYLGVAESTVTEAAAFEDGTVAKIRDAQVMAVAKTGFVIGDGQTNMYVEGERSVTAGDIVQLSGKCAVKGGVPAFVVDGLEVGQNAELRPAEPVVVDGTSTSYPFDKVTYAKVSGTIIGNLLRLSGGVNCKIIDPVESVGATELNVHKVEALCYYVGTFDKQYAFVIFSLKDNGVDDTVGKPLPYSDDFSWLAPYIELANSKLPEASKISDCVGAVTSSADGCANIYTTLKDNGCDVLGELRSRGYTDLNPGFKTIYLQDAYFKFGKTNCQSGLTLPLFKIDGEQDIVVSFRWCSQMQGSGKIDETHMVVAIDGPGTVVTAKGTDGAKISDPLAHSQKQGQMMWQDAMFTIKGATTATAITIRSNEFGSPDDVVKDVFRYYLDDIEVMLAADAVTADIKVEGIENDLITFEGTPAAPVKFNVTSSAAFKVSSSANWLHVENGEGGAGQTNEVTVTCDQSELSVLRKAEITVKSGVSTKKIQVVQSAAGGELDPLISISSGNSVEVLGQGAEFTAMVQANVAFETEIKDSWISEVEVPATRSMVETTVKTFKAEPNLTSADRVGTIRFYKGNLESVLTVKQTKFEPKVVMTINKLSALPAEATKVAVHIEANVDTKVSSDVITLPANELKAGKYDFEVTVPANSGSFRNVKVVFENDEYSYKYTYSVLQLGSAMTTMFFDDFGWLQQYVDAYNATAAEDKKVGDTIGKNNKSAEAPNIYGKADWQKSLLAELATKGYEDMCSREKVVYLQPQYLKFGRTKGHNTSIRLPKLDIGGTTDIVTDFDWAAMAQGDGTIDDTKLVVVIEGDGLFDNGTKYSDLIVNDQPKDKMYWTHSAVKINGASSNTRLVIVMYRVLKKDAAGNYTGEYNYNVGGAGRFFLDNIRISK